MKKIIVLILLFLMTSCTTIEKKEYTFFAMDTFISITFYGVKDTNKIVKEIRDIYYLYDDISNNYANDSKDSIYYLNTNRECEIKSELAELLTFSLNMMDETNGFFNPFIGRLSIKWKEALEKKELLSADVVKEELNIMNNTSLLIEGSKATLIGDGDLDLGGIAKGYATHKVKEYLDSILCDNYLLNAGTSNIVLGSKNGESFNVGFSKATTPGYYYVASKKNVSISTSSIKEQHTIIDEIYYSHLINPKTGYPQNKYDSLSIIGQDSGSLDAYTTACINMDLDELIIYLSDKNLDFLVSKDNKLLYSSLGE